MSTDNPSPSKAHEVSAKALYDPDSQILEITLDLADENRAIEIDAVALFQEGEHVARREAWFEPKSPPPK